MHGPGSCNHKRDNVGVKSKKITFGRIIRDFTFIVKWVSIGGLYTQSYTNGF